MNRNDDYQDDATRRPAKLVRKEIQPQEEEKKDSGKPAKRGAKGKKDDKVKKGEHLDPHAPNEKKLAVIYEFLHKYLQNCY